MTDDIDRIVKDLDAQMARLAKGKTFEPDRYICFAPRSVIAFLRGRGNTKQDVIIAGYKVRCRVGSYPDIQKQQRGFRP
jgi:hypothetical protein